jgi:small conductance mechanosensitive channel
MSTITPTPVAGATSISGFFKSDDPIIIILLTIIWALVILLIALLVARYTRVWLVRLLARSRISLNIATLMGNLANATVVAVGIIIALSILGVGWTTLLTVLGTVGLALSLSMQDVLKNVIAGIYILLEQPFKIGDRITVKDVTGNVQGIELRTTILRTDDGLQVVVPNNVVFTEILTNRSVTDHQRAVLRLQLRRGSITGISEQINEILKDNPDVAASPTPVIALEGIQDGIAELRIEFWVPTAHKVTLTAQAVEAIRARFPDADVTVKA